MKKMFTLLMSLMVFTAIFAQYNRVPDNNRYDNRTATYNGGNYNNNYGNYPHEQVGALRHDDDHFRGDDHRDGFDRRRDDEGRMNNYHQDYGYPVYDHDRDDWGRRRHRGFGVLGTGLLIGAAVGVAIAAHR